MKIILTVLLILVFISIYMCSCEYNDLGLLNTLDDEEGISSKENAGDELGVGKKEFSLELGEEQKNKNLLNNDVNVRKAIFYAIDREKIVNELFGEYNEVLNSLFAKDSYSYIEGTNIVIFDPPLAAENYLWVGMGLNDWDPPIPEFPTSYNPYISSLKIELD